jgi:mono/diheme cytochrome c family protein
MTDPAFPAQPSAEQRHPRTKAIIGVFAGLAVLIVAFALFALHRPHPVRVPSLDDARRIEAGRLIYARECASCHGGHLEGQPNWTSRLPSGRLPAPPHDESGHTWHHPSVVLFEITKFGMKPPHAPADYQSDMQGFGGRLSDDEIWNVIAFIRSRWPEKIRVRHQQLDEQFAKQERH